MVTDGEMRRAGFFTAEFYRHLTGVRALPPDRRLGAGGHDQQHRFEVLEAIAAPNGLGVVGEFRDGPSRGRRGRSRSRCPGRTRCPGGSRTGPGEVYRDRASPPPRRSCRSCAPSSAALVDAGADDHPGRRAVAGDPPERRPTSRRCSTRPSSPPVGRVRLGAHLCFGNFLGRPLARALLPPGPRRDARLPRRRARPRVRQPRDGRGRRRCATSPTPVATSRPA